MMIKYLFELEQCCIGCEYSSHTVLGVPQWSCSDIKPGSLWITNDLFDLQVNFCPLCGKKALVPIE